MHTHFNVQCMRSIKMVPLTLPNEQETQAHLCVCVLRHFVCYALCVLMHVVYLFVLCTHAPGTPFIRPSKNGAT